VGHKVPFALGEISGVPGHHPYEDEFKVVQLGDGRFTCTGPMFHGFRMALGPMAVLEKDGVRVVLASKKCQAADQEMFRHVGIEPREQRILALKSSVHFRADFEPIAREVLVVAAPGPAKADPTMFSWSRLRPGLRLKPKGPPFKPPVTAAGSCPPLRHRADPARPIPSPRSRRRSPRSATAADQRSAMPRGCASPTQTRR
jgi:microcystin degradation protein MlrC